MDALSFLIGAVTVLVAILVGYLFGRGKPPEDVVGTVKRTVSGAKAEGEILNNPEPEDEQITLRAKWHNDIRKKPSTPPPEGLILTDDEQEAVSP